MVRRIPSKHRNAHITRERDTNAVVRLGLLLIVGLGLACGFVYAGRQHFVALKYGYETEKLRRDRDQLVEEQRRLILQREEAASPVKLEQAAKRIGMQALQPAQVDPLRQVAKTVVKDALTNPKVNTRKFQQNTKSAAKPPAKAVRNKPI